MIVFATAAMAMLSVLMLFGLSLGYGNFRAGFHLFLLSLMTCGLGLQRLGSSSARELSASNVVDWLRLWRAHPDILIQKDASKVTIGAHVHFKNP